jgi:poly(3-hydroxybutyrate) depolymerase
MLASRRPLLPASLRAVFLLASSVLTAEARLEETVVHGQALEGNLLGDSPDRSVVVYLPPSYDTSPDRRYPVVYLLHGWTMHSVDWIGKADWGGQFDISNTLDRFTAENPSREVIVVMPDAFNKYLGSWYTNSPVTGNWEDFLTQELVPYIDATYRTLPQVAHRGIAGYSMGGAGAWRLATRSTGLYAALYDLDGGLTGPAVGFMYGRNAWRAILAGTADASTNSLELGTAAAFSPNPGNPPYFIDAPYEVVGDSLVYLEAIGQRWVHAYDVVDMLRTHPASLPLLTAIRFGYSKGEGPTSARAISQALAGMGIAHIIEEYEGDHIDDLPGRVETRLLPFMARVLHGELPQVRSATVDLGTIVAGQSVPEVTVVLAAPPQATGTYPELSLDLSSLGVAEPLPMQHDGSGRYTARPFLTPLRTGPYGLFVSMEEDTDSPFPLSLLSLTVWPAGDLQVITDAVAEGWKIQGQLKVTLDPQASAQAYQGRSALAAQTNGLWKIVLSPAQPLSPLGYTALRFAFHPGDASGDVLDVAIGTKKANLWPGKPGGAKVDLAVKSWQVVEIPLDGLGPYISITSIGFSGKLTGTFYVDDLRLVASAPPPPPPPTAVLEDHAASLPQRFALEQNYPNPFNSETVIRFALQASAKVELALYNLAGQKVATLAEGVREAGAYTLRWDGRDDSGRELASGVYVYRLQGGSRTETRKLLLLR